MAVANREWTPRPNDLSDVPLNPEYLAGARNAVRTCLAVRPGEVVTLITDEGTRDIAASLLFALCEAEALPQVSVLEDVAARPLQRMPVQVMQQVAQSTVTIACIQPQQGEIYSRRELVEAVEERQIRYAHMVWISDEIMRQGMRADYHAVDALSDGVLAWLRPARTVTVRSAAGTDVRVTLDSTLRWIKTSGLITPELWSNLPAGEVFTTPDSIEGVFVVDGTVGDYLCPKYGDLSAHPLTLEIEGGRLRAVHCANAELLDEFTAYCRAEENGDRVGEFALGTNIAVERMIGNLLQDEKVPGVHIAFGNPYGSQTGAAWTCNSHIDAITRNCDVWADDHQIMANGHFLV
jgi:leucyl aminopeptidase (aminopeptidase T)